MTACPNCGQTNDRAETICVNCGYVLDLPSLPETPSAPPPPPRTRDPITPLPIGGTDSRFWENKSSYALLSLCCFPGLGQLLMGQVFKGLAIGGVQFLAYSFQEELDLTGLIWFVSMVDAFCIATKLNRGRAVGPWEWF